MTLTSARHGRLYAKMELHAQIRWAVIRAYALMDGRDQIAVKILTIVRMRLVLMVPPVSMVWAVFIVAAFRVKRVYCAIWMMLAHRIHAMRMPFVIQVQSMDRIHAPVHLATKV